MNDTEQAEPQAAQPVVQRQRIRVSLVWLVPLVAALLGVSLVVQSLMSAGPRIAISFQTAAGLEAGKTEVKYKDVPIGRVTHIALSEDHRRVQVSVDLLKDAGDFARAGTRFWVERPRIGAGGISGIETVLSGAYIAADLGNEDDEQRQFLGLETPPTVVSGTPGRRFVLHADDLGSLEIGSPVYYRRLQVGEVASYQLDDDGQSVRVQVFVRAPYDHFVTTASRFWNASGLDLSLGADGLKLNTESLATVIAGGIAFGEPVGSKAEVAQDMSEFELAHDREIAMAPPDGQPVMIRMRFEQALRGLSVNAPVEFLGVNIGRVMNVDLDYDRSTQRFPVIVDARIYPQRLGRALSKLPAHDKEQHRIGHFVAGMVANGLRAQARTGNLLTGQLFIALDFMPHATRVSFDGDAEPLEIPTVGGNLDKLQEQMFDILAKLDKVPFDEIGTHLNNSLKRLDDTLAQVDREVLPQATETLRSARGSFAGVSSALADDGPLQQSLHETLTEVQRAARSMRVLGDMLARHPEALLRGRNDQALPPKSSEKEQE